MTTEGLNERLKKGKRDAFHKRIKVVCIHSSQAIKVQNQRGKKDFED